MVVYGLFCEKYGLKCDETAHFCTFLVFVDVGAGCFFVVQRVGMFFSQIWIDVVEKFVLGVFYRDKKGLFS